MNYKEFKNHLEKELKIYINPYGFDREKLARSANIDYENSDFIGHKWITGGMTGGNCWGNEPYSCEPESEPEFKELDKILEEFYEDITFLQYRKLAASLIKTDSDVESGWYGNYYYYNRKWIFLKDLYDYFVKCEKILP